MKRLFKNLAIILCVTLSFVIKSYGQSACPNSDFSTGGFADWTGSVGENDGSTSGLGYTAMVGMIIGAPNQSPYAAGQQTIMNAPGTDPNTLGLLSVIPPGYTTSCMLGNAQVEACDNGSYPQAAQLNYDIWPVTASNCVFTYQYAVVLQNPGHPQPRFEINVLDATGVQIGGPCGTYTVTSAGSIPGFTTCAPSPLACESDDVEWKDWTSVTIDLSPWITQNVTIQFTAFDCTQGGHFGYAYIRCQCGALRCTEQCLGTSIDISAPVGFASYQWSNGGPATQNWNINPIPANGTVYSCLLTSVGGCQFTVYDTINAQPVNFTVNSDSICSGQTTTLTASSNLYSYNWTGGGTTQSISVSPTTTTNYIVTATATGGCTKIDTSTVTVTQIPVANAGNPVTICPGVNTTLDASGSTGTNLIYHWNIGPTTPQIIVNPTITTTYTVTVVSNGCTSDASVTITVANALTVTALPDTTICLGGSATLIANGATTYLWTPSGTLSSSIGTNVIAMPNTTTVYTVVGTSNGCTGQSNVTVNVNSVAINVNPTTSLICLGGSGVNLIASGGSTYIWSPSGSLSSSIGTTVTANPTTNTSYMVTGTDVIGCTNISSAVVNVSHLTVTATATNEYCNHSNGTATANPIGSSGPDHYTWNTLIPQHTQIATNLPAGTYIVTVTDNVCSATAQVSLIDLPGPTVAIASFNNTTCGYANGNITANANGGFPQYNYLWNGGHGGNILNNVIAGTYTVTVTDSANCTASVSITITDTPGPIATISSSLASCGMSDGSATVVPTGGTLPYTFVWSSHSVNSPNLINIPTGNYCVTITDANTCSTSECVFVGEKPGPTVSAISVNEICGQQNGTATANPLGGLGTYTYLWNNNSTTQTVTGLVTGNYSVTISDGGCTASTTVFVGETPGPRAYFLYDPKILTILEGPVYFWDASVGNVDNWLWLYGDNTIGNGVYTIHPYPNVGTYLVTEIVIDSNGCKDTISDTVKVVDIYTFYIPNSFTPNSDGWNDFWSPKGMNVDPNDYNELIYDRWGNLVFKTNKWNVITNEAEGWNGTLSNRGNISDVVMDVYVYKIDTREINNGPKHEYIGRITLVP
jgi:gliding motility-associated-like protein